MWWLWLGIGLTVGACAGVLLGGLASASKIGDLLAENARLREAVRTARLR